jgi:hypothetical protein
MIAHEGGDKHSQYESYVNDLMDGKINFIIFNNLTFRENADNDDKSLLNFLFYLHKNDIEKLKYSKFTYNKKIDDKDDSIDTLISLLVNILEELNENFTSIDITLSNKIRGGGKTKRANRKEILGKERCIYKKTGDRKEYVKHKGDLITVKDYKKIIKARNNKKI